MKRAFSLLLALTLCLTLAACGSFMPAATTTAPVETTDPVQAALNTWLETNKTALLTSMEASFASSSGMTCTSGVEIVGSGMVITININEFENVPQETKDQLQAAYDTLNSEFAAMLAQMQLEIPQLSYFTIVVGDKNADVLATITTGEQ